MRKIVTLSLFIILSVVSSSLQAYDSGNIMIYQCATVFRTEAYTKYAPFDINQHFWINDHTYVELEVNLPYAMTAYLTFYGEFDNEPEQLLEDLQATLLNTGEEHCWYEEGTTYSGGWHSFTVPESFNFQAGTNAIRITHPWWYREGNSDSIQFQRYGWLRITTFIPSRGLLRLAFLPGACAQRMDLRKVKLTKTGTEKDL